MDIQNMARGKFNVFLRLALLAALGIIVFLVIDYSKQQSVNIIEHRDQVDNNSVANRARLDVINCIISVSPTTRTPEYVKGCYDQVEETHDIEVQRYGDGV